MSVKSFYIHESQKNSETAKTLESTQEVQFVTTKPQINHYRDGKKHLHISEKKGEIMDRCATLSEDYICCNVHVIKSVSNCPYDCSYCFLQDYLNSGTTTVVGDTSAILQEVTTKIAEQPWRLFRIGNWELGDSLALEPITGSSAELVLEFAKLPNAILELKTKSAHVDNLLNLDHQQRTVVSWSLSPSALVRQEEHKTASTEERLEAMHKVANAGYLVGVHFDPMVIYDNWQQDYQQLAEALYQAVPAQQIAWISMGSLRFSPNMKKTIEDNFPGSRMTSTEMIAGPDGKMRYPKPLRLQQYQVLYQALQQYGTADNFTYLCMERWDIWQRIFGSNPRSIGHLDYLMAASLYQRYPALRHCQPNLSLYDPD